jgi:hypothetical protein
MKTTNGTGTILYGRSAKRTIQPPRRRLEIEASGFAPYSYQATKWFVLFFLPVIPMGSFRVIPSDQGFFSTEQSEYLLEPAPWNVIQVLTHYVIGWGSLFLVKWLVWDVLLS